MKITDNIENASCDKTQKMKVPVGTCNISVQEFKDNLAQLASINTVINKKVNIKDLSKVAISGSYKDLKDLPSFKTINNESIIGHGNITINQTPSITEEFDPIFSNSPAARITDNDIENWNSQNRIITRDDLSDELKNQIDAAITQETDPTVPSWAKAAKKPTYTADEVKAVPIIRRINNKQLNSNITLTYSDVKALPDTTKIPSKVSELVNDTKFITKADTIQQIYVNNTPATISDGKAEVTIGIPHNLSELTADNKHQTVSNSDKENWNNKVSGVTLNNKQLTPDTNKTIKINTTTSVSVNGSTHNVDSDGNINLGNISGSTEVDLTEINNSILTLQQQVSTLQTLFNTNSQTGNIAYAIGSGTFSEAYAKSNESGFDTKIFTWLLQDKDDDDTPVNKLIYHIGHGRFIDAIGAEINGKLDGLTIVTNGIGAYLALAGGVRNSVGKSYNKIIPLKEGRNNFTYEDLVNYTGGERTMSTNTLGNDYITKNTDTNQIIITNMRFINSNTEYPVGDSSTVHAIDGIPSYASQNSVERFPGQAQDIDHIVSVDFGGFIVKDAYGLFRFNKNLLSVYGFRCFELGNYKYLFVGSSVISVELFGNISSDTTNKASFYRTFSNATNLTYLDLSNLYGAPSTKNSTYFTSQLIYNTNVRTLDLHNLDLSEEMSWDNAFSNSSLNTLIIGSKFTSGTSLDKSFTNMPKNMVSIVYVGDEAPTYNIPSAWKDYIKEFKIPYELKDAYQSGEITVVGY